MPSKIEAVEKIYKKNKKVFTSNLKKMEMFPKKEKKSGKRT